MKLFGTCANEIQVYRYTVEYTTKNADGEEEKAVKQFVSEAEAEEFAERVNGEKAAIDVSGYEWIDGLVVADVPDTMAEAMKVFEKGEGYLAEREIAALKERLAGTDYKVIKCMECSLLGEPLPYDAAELHEERQAVRDEINGLEGVL